MYMTMKDYVNWKMSHDIKYGESEGYPLILEQCRKNKNLKDFKIYGNSIQDGTPTPEAPIEIQSVGELVVEGEAAGKYKIPVVARGKNLFNINNSKNKYQATYGKYTRIENGFKVTCTKSHQFFRISVHIPKENFEEGKTYTLTCNGNIRDIYIGESNSTGDTATLKKFGQFKTNTCCFTIGEITKTYVCIFFYSKNYNVGDILTVENIQIEKGESNGEYEGYIEPQIVNIYLDEPLRKLGDYADYIDFANQRVIRNTKQEIITEIDTMSSNSTTYQRFTPKISEEPLINGSGVLCTGTVISNKFKSTDISYKDLGNHSGIIMPYITTSKKNTVALTFNNTEINTVTKAQEAIGDGFEVCYILAEAIKEDVELSSLPKTKSKTMIYEVDTTIEPSDMYGKYVKKY